MPKQDWKDWGLPMGWDEAAACARPGAQRGGSSNMNVAGSDLGRHDLGGSRVAPARWWGNP